MLQNINDIDKSGHGGDKQVSSLSASDYRATNMQIELTLMPGFEMEIGRMMGREQLRVGFAAGQMGRVH